MRVIRSFFALCAAGLALVCPDRAEADMSLVTITQITSVPNPTSGRSDVVVTIANDGAADASFVLRADAQFGYVDPNRPLFAKAHTKITTTLAGPGWALCRKIPTIDLQLTGSAPGLDTRVRRAKHPAPSFAQGTVLLNAGAAGIPPTAPQVKLNGASLEGGYACGRPAKVRAHVVNDTDNAPQHLSIVLLAIPIGGSAPELAAAHVTIGAHSAVDMLLESSSVPTGIPGTMSIELREASSELGGALGYWRSADVEIKDTSSGAWTME